MPTTNEGPTSPSVESVPEAMAPEPTQDYRDEAPLSDRILTEILTEQLINAGQPVNDATLRVQVDAAAEDLVRNMETREARRMSRINGYLIMTLVEVDNFLHEAYCQLMSCGEPSNYENRTADALSALGIHIRNAGRTALDLRRELETLQTGLNVLQARPLQETRQ